MTDRACLIRSAIALLQPDMGDSSRDYAVRLLRSALNGTAVATVTFPSAHAEQIRTALMLGLAADVEGWPQPSSRSDAIASAISLLEAALDPA